MHMTTILGHIPMMYCQLQPLQSLHMITRPQKTLFNHLIFLIFLTFWWYNGMVTQGRDPWLAYWDLRVLCFVVLFPFTLALTVLTKCTWSQLRYFLSIKKISILTANKFWFIFVFIWLYSMHWFLTESTIYLCPTPVNYKCCKSWD